MASYFVNRLKAWLEEHERLLPPSDERLLRCRPADLRNLPPGDLEYLKTLGPDEFQERYVAYFVSLLQEAGEAPDEWRQRLERARGTGYSDLSDLLVARALERYDEYLS